MIPDSMYDSTTLADRIKFATKEKGVSLKAMLEELGLGSNTMSHMRHGKMPAADTLARIADFLGCSVDFLMGRTVDPAVQRMNLTDDERQKVTDYLQFILSQRK